MRVCACDCASVWSGISRLVDPACVCACVLVCVCVLKQFGVFFGRYYHVSVCKVCGSSRKLRGSRNESKEPESKEPEIWSAPKTQSKTRCWSALSSTLPSTHSHTLPNANSTGQVASRRPSCPGGAKKCTQRGMMLALKWSKSMMLPQTSCSCARWKGSPCKLKITHTHVRTHAHIRTYTHTHTRAHTPAYTHAGTQAHVHMHMQMSMHIDTRTRIRAHARTHTHTRAHTHWSTQNTNVHAHSRSLQNVL